MMDGTYEELGDGTGTAVQLEFDVNSRYRPVLESSPGRRVHNQASATMKYRSSSVETDDLHAATLTTIKYALLGTHLSFVDAVVGYLTSVHKHYYEHDRWN